VVCGGVWGCVGGVGGVGGVGVWGVGVGGCGGWGVLAVWGCGVTPYVRHSTDCTCCDFGHLRFLCFDLLCGFFTRELIELRAHRAASS
jgi:hypothetical protein